MTHRLASYIALLAMALLVTACGKRVPTDAVATPLAPSIHPDYAGVDVPVNIAPLNFKILTPGDDYVAHIHRRGADGIVTGGPVVDIDIDQWHDMLKQAQGDSVYVDIYVHNQGQWYALKPFGIAVGGPIDPYVSYRLIEPSYVSYEQMRICQRHLEDFDESTIYNNSAYTDDANGQCINCHSYQDYNRGGNMQMHVRFNHGGTLIVHGDEARKVDLKTPQTAGAGVYPSWHPTLPLIAYSVNKTDQAFHSRNRNKIEVQDAASDLILYDVEANKVSVISADTTQLECFPYWSPEGDALYYVSAQLPDTVTSANIDAYRQRHYADIKYDIMRRSFDKATRTFGPVDTVFLASAVGMSATHPRPSRDGRHLVFTMAEYGVFHIWHHDADLYVIDLADGSVRPLEGANSDDTESFHSFSSSGEWLVFSSRRDDGNYTRLYVTRFRPDGTATKPFMLPQRNPDQNTWLYKSYNVPELMAAPVTISRPALLDAIAAPALQATN